MSSQPPAVLALRIAAVVLALVAVWGPALSASSRTQRMVLLDVSAGCDSGSADLLALADDLDRGDSLRLATFGAGIAPAQDMASYDVDAWRDAFARPGLPADVAPAPGTASDLAAALEFAAANAEGPDTGARMDVVVVGDGRATSTDDDLEDAAMALRRAGCASLSFRPLPRRDLGPRVTAVRGPGRVRRGGVFAIVVEGVAAATASTTQPSTVQLLADGTVVATRDVEAGPFRVAFPDRVTDAGLRVYEARVDGASVDRAARAHVVIGDPGRALLLSGDAGRAGLGESLGVPYDTVPLDVDRLDERIAAYDVAVLDGLPPGGTQRALAAWVRRGGGVVLLAGPDVGARGAGALVDASPLCPAPPDDPGAFLYVAVDGSGSMAETWPGGTLSRDEVVRSAVAAVLAEQPGDVTVALRRFNDRLQPVGSPPWIGRPAGEGDTTRRALAEWPTPGGGTALIPVLREALQLVRSRRERSCRALIFTDGRFADDAAELAVAASDLNAAGCVPAIVVGGEDARDALEQALAGTGAEVVMVADAFALTPALREASAGAGELLRDVALRITDSGRRVPGLASPTTARAVVKRWPAGDAQVWIATDAGAPVAAVRHHGEGRIAALATRPADASCLVDSVAARELVSALRASVERAADAEVRLERDGDRILVRVAGRAPTHALLTVDGQLVRAALQPAPGGMLQADLRAAEAVHAPVTHQAGEGVVRLVDERGAEVWSAGLDRPAPPEFVRERSVVTERLSRLAGGVPASRGTPLRPWLAALAIVSLLLAHVISFRDQSSRRGVLPI